MLADECVVFVNSLFAFLRLPQQATFFALKLCFKFAGLTPLCVAISLESVHVARLTLQSSKFPLTRQARKSCFVPSGVRNKRVRPCKQGKHLFSPFLKQTMASSSSSGRLQSDFKYSSNFKRYTNSQQEGSMLEMPPCEVGGLSLET